MIQEKQCDKCGKYISDLDYANGSGLCENCRQTQELCKKCGNPVEMYWCAECESNSEDSVCTLCGKDVGVLDKEYHNECDYNN